MSNIYLADISALKAYNEQFKTESNKFNNVGYNTFLGSYLNSCSNQYVRKMSNRLNPLYELTKTGYENIATWWSDYNSNVIALEEFLSGNNQAGVIKETGIRNIAISLPLLQAFNASPLNYLMATNGKFTGFLSQTDILSSKLPEMGLGEQIANWNSPYPDSFSENQRIVYEALKKEGYNDAVIAGIMGNIMQESNFRTSSYNGNEDGGGFCGWLYEYFPEMRGEESAEAQINYLIDTLNNPIHNNQKNTKSALLAIENTPEGARQAAYIFATEYEHCASSSHTSRQDFASNFYESFATGNSGQQINVINNQQVNNTFSSQENQNIENLGENKTESVSSLKDDSDILVNDLPEINLGSQSTDWNSPYPDNFSANQKTVYDALKKEGYNDAVIAGIMGNIMRESGFNTSSYNGNEDGGGFCGWKYEYFPEMRGEESAEAQINYLIDTLNNPIHSNQKNTKSALLAVENTPEGARQAAYIFASEYEHCSDTSDTKRADFASDFYESISN